MAELTAHGIQLSSKETYVNIDEKTNQLMQKEAEFKDIASTVIRQTSNYTSANMKVAASAETMTGGYIMIQGELEGPITTILQTMFDNMKKVTTEQQTMVQNIEKRFTEPMRTLVNYKFANVEYAKDQVKKSVATYQDHMEQFSKNISLKSAKEASKFITLEKELQQLKEVINQNTETFIETYQQFSKTKNRTLVSSYTNLVRDLHAYHKKSLETMDKILPMVEGIEQEYRKQEEIDPIVGEKIIKEGLLSIKRTKWNDEYCELRGGKFYCYKADTAFSPENTLELQLCSVKSILPEKEREKVSKETAACCFQVFTPGQARPMIVRCESESVKKEWEAAFLEGISAALDNGRDGKQTQNDADNNNETVLAIVREIPGNTVCADCGAPEPVWASINLGIVVCLGCSGIHRSLGSHISKVRSLTLDHWDPELLMYMTQLGNTRANQFFECRAMQFDQSLRPTENSKTEDRKVWINMKYKEKKFIPPLPEGYSLDTTFYELVKLNKEMDIMRAVTLLFYGADTEQIDCFGLTPLMQACIADNWLYAQALVLHGKNILATDLQKWTALHHATYHNSYRSLQVLTRGLKDFDLTTLTDYANDTPMNIASRFDFKEATIILNKESLLSFKVTKRLLDLMENENKFSLKSFEEITSIELLTEDVKEDSESEEEVSEFEVHPDESQVKWVRAADSNVDTVKSTDKSKFNLIPKKKKSTKIKQATLSRVAAADRPFRRKSSTPSLLEKVDSAGKRSQITDFASNLSQAPDPELEDLTSGDD